MQHITCLQDKHPQNVKKVNAQYQNFENEVTSFEIDIYYRKFSERLTCRNNIIFKV